MTASKNGNGHNEKKLTRKQTLFVAHYLTCWNASEAARRAGYPTRSAYAVGWENLRKPEIAALVAAKMAEQVMSAEEVLSRLSQMASANLIDVLNADDEFDFELARKTGMLHLVKKLKRRQFTDKDGNTTRETEVELHDAQAALDKLAKHYKLYTSVIEINDWREQARRDGYDPDGIFGKLVEAGRARLDGGGEGRGVPRSEADRGATEPDVQ